MADLWVFIQALLNHWVGLMSGIASVCVALWLRFRRHPDITTYVFVVIAIVCFLIAFFYTWQEEHQKVEVEHQKVENARQSYDSLQITRRAYVNLGNPEGILMKWRLLEPGKPGVIDMYFQNTGATEAREFWVNSHVGLMPLRRVDENELLDPNKRKLWGMKSFFDTHIRPKTPPQQGQRPYELITVTVPGHAPYTREAATQGTLSKDDVEAIPKGGIQVLVAGTLEYVDIFDAYCCKTFLATWRYDRAEFVRLPPALSSCPTHIPSFCHD